MLNDLQWQTLSSHRKSARLSMLYKSRSIDHVSTPPLPSYYISTKQLIRYYQDLHYIIPSVRTNAYKYSFPRTIIFLLKNRTVCLQALLSVIPYSSSKASSIYSHISKDFYYYLIMYIIVILGQIPWAYQLWCLPSN